jgi:DNA-binding NarL/FixJ family response regulator
MTTTATRTLNDRAAGIERMIRALVRNPEEWDVEDLRLLSAIDAEVTDARSKAIYALRECGVTDSQIGAQLHVTQQAVSKRWPGGRRSIGAAGRYRKSP